MNVVTMRILLFVTLGGALATAHLAALDWNLRLYLEARRGWIALMTHVVRLLAIAATFVLMAHEGALALLSGAAGFQMMRTLIINQRTLGLGKS
ncbi:MAG TPA: ATP synthase subunit I [Candidatus Binataceae bacterium]|nr:ATP synthase subunit I [Candidatus Binataceae bacterium]